MKTFTRIFTAMTAAALLAASCINEDPNYVKPDPPKPTGDKGYLAVSGLAMRVVYDDKTDTQPDDATESGTRATPAVDDFIVEIFDAAETSVLRTTYGELRQRTEPVELAVGGYRLDVRSEQTIPTLDWEHPVYGSSRGFSIVKSQTTELEEIVCTLQNIKVTFVCSADLAAMLTPQTTATVALGATTATFAKGESRAAYFQAVAEENKLEFRLTGNLTAEYGSKPVQVSKTIDKVKAGQWRKITLVITLSNEGEITFDIIVDTFIDDEEVIIDASDDEPTYGDDPEDPEAPEIVWRGYDIDQQYQVVPGMQIDIDVTSPTGIASFVVEILSEPLSALLPEIGLPDTFDLCDVSDELAPMLGPEGLGFPINDDVKGKTFIPFSITVFVEILLEIPGEHNFRLTVRDENGEVTTKTIQLVV